MGEQHKTFKEAVAEYKTKLSHIQLPDLDMAMHPNKVYFTDDISNKKHFNERYIESNVGEGMSAFAIYLMAGMHNFLLVSLLYVLFFLDGVETDISMYIISLIGYLVILAPLYLTVKNYHANPVRFNRQAQCIHIFWNTKTAITFPWKEAVPFSAVGQTSSGRHNLVFLCEIPKNAFKGSEQLSAMEVPGAFDSGDYSMDGNLSRQEFIRAYMEKGLEAIQPDKKAMEDGYVFVPGGHEKKLTVKTHGLITIIPNAIERVFYYMGTGWLVDKWLAKRAKSYQWPDDVQKLCAEGADLSGLDTSVIVPREDLFYGTIKGDFTYLDRNGNEVT